MELKTEVTLKTFSDYFLTLGEPFDIDDDEVILTVKLGKASMFTNYD